MSGGNECMQLETEDIHKMVAANTHIGAEQCNFQMRPYTFDINKNHVYIINLKRTWEKLLLAARAIVAIECPGDICVISSRSQGQRAILKFAKYTGANAIAGRFTPGTFTNQIQAAFREPRLLMVTDPRIDHQAIREASYVNLPVIAFCNTDTHLKYVDLAIPCNNRAPNSIGLMWWMMAREVLRMRGTLSRDTTWEVMPDLFFYREPEEVEKEEAERDGVTVPMVGMGGGLDGDAGVADTAGGFAAAGNWNDDLAPQMVGAGAMGAPGGFGAVGTLPPAVAGGGAAPAGGVGADQDDWAAASHKPADDWAATPMPGVAPPPVIVPGGAGTAPATGGDTWGGEADGGW